MSAPSPQAGAKPPGIPTPPRKGSKHRQRNFRPLIWALALALGAALGVLGYAGVPDLSDALDYWLALALR